MGMKKTIVVCGLLTALLFLGPVASVSADLIVPGQKSVGFSYTISNMNQYSNYVFILFGEPLCSARVITPGQEFGFYKFAQPSIYAIKTTDYNDSILTMNETEQKQYLQNNPLVMQSNIVLTSGYTTVAEENPLESSQIVLAILSLDDTGFEIEKTKIIFTYTDGTTEEQAFTSQDVTPTPSRSTMTLSWSNSLWFIILPLTALASIVLVLVKRRKKQ